MVDLYNIFCKALVKGKYIRAIFCGISRAFNRVWHKGDISKAFDRVWHKGLLYKLNPVGIHGPLLTWFSNYLTDRKQRVVLPFINAGVAQSSILDPLLFLLFINDVVEGINSTLRLFADNTSPYIFVDNPIHAAVQLNNDLLKVHQWAVKWLVTFNPEKSEYIIFSRKHNKLYHPPVVMDHTETSEFVSRKHQGVILFKYCTKHTHFECIKSKAWNRTNIMRKLKFTPQRKLFKLSFSPLFALS